MQQMEAAGGEDIYDVASRAMYRLLLIVSRAFRPARADAQHSPPSARSDDKPNAHRQSEEGGHVDAAAILAHEHEPSLKMNLHNIYYLNIFKR